MYMCVCVHACVCVCVCVCFAFKVVVALSLLNLFSYIFQKTIYEQLSKGDISLPHIQNVFQTLVS